MAVRVAWLVPGIMGSSLFLRKRPNKRDEIWGGNFLANCYQIINDPYFRAVSFSEAWTKEKSRSAAPASAAHCERPKPRYKEDQVEQKMQIWDMTATEVRTRIREGEHLGPTSGVARGHVQANLVILPSEYAFDFLKFCVRNLKPCPVLEVTDVGSPEPSVVAPGADLRTDVPKYRVYENGQLVDEPTDILSYWRDDLVSFLLGCSFTFETALLAAGLHMAHIDQGRNVPMYITNRDCVPSGPFAGPLVVSMRPFRGEEVPLAVTISARYPMMHGSPVHIGSPEALGINDLQTPGFGDPISIAEDQTPVFWACGVTPQAAAKQARPALMITHSPGHMFITDRVDAEYEI